MLRLDTHAQGTSGIEHYALLKVVTLAEFARRGWPPERSALWIGDDQALVSHPELLRLPWGACIAEGEQPRPPHWTGPWVSTLRDRGVVAPGDVIAVRPDSARIKVHYRRGANSNVLFVTERCNSHCLMCSQPPKPGDDGWRIGELLELIELIDPEERSLGITGGEPTLLGDGLLTIIQACKEQLPSTGLHILSNGRLLASTPLAAQMSRIGHPDIMWGIPLYADTAARHDYIVQAHGAFDETVKGLYRLAQHGQAIEIRVVLHQASLPRLEQLAYYIFRNLPFVAHVALMGLEPMGFARGNRTLLWVDPEEYMDVLESAVYFLANRGLSVSIYNLPLCVLPKTLWPFARQSISDWKNDFIDACTGCAARGLCAGFFSSAGPSWVSRAVRPLTEEDLACKI